MQASQNTEVRIFQEYFDGTEKLNTILVRSSLKIKNILKCWYCNSIKNRQTILADKYCISIEKI